MTTVALDHGVVKVLGIAVYLFGTPGNPRFEVIRKILSEGADGAIVVADASDSSEGHLKSAVDILRLCRKYLALETPVFVAATKIDLLNEEEKKKALERIKSALSIPEVRVMGFFPVSSVSGTGIERLLSFATLSIVSRYLGTLRGVRDHGKEGLEFLASALKMNPRDTLLMMQWLSWHQFVFADWEYQKFHLPSRVKDIVEILDYAHKLSTADR